MTVRMDKRVTRDFARRLQACRIAAGYGSADKFAKTLGIPGPTYRRWERGEVDPNLGQLKLLSEHTGKTIDFLVKGTSEPPSPSH